MQSHVDERLRREAADFRFVFSCEACAYFDPDRAICSEGYPTAPHLRADLERVHVVFCKLFEGA